MVVKIFVVVVIRVLEIMGVIILKEVWFNVFKLLNVFKILIIVLNKLIKGVVEEIMFNIIKFVVFCLRIWCF